MHAYLLFPLFTKEANSENTKFYIIMRRILRTNDKRITTTKKSPPKKFVLKKEKMKTKHPFLCSSIKRAMAEKKNVAKKK